MRPKGYVYEAKGYGEIFFIESITTKEYYGEKN
jgi:hypothetical protein